MDVGKILCTIPPIVEAIFENLNTEELDSCSQVCELWQRIAETERSRRKDVAYFFQGLHCPLHDKIHSSSEECSLDISKAIESELNVQLKDLHLKPEYCITFATRDFIDDFKHLFPSFHCPSPVHPKRLKCELDTTKRAYLKAAIQIALGQYLPKKCKTTFCVAPGIIGCNNSIPVEIEEGCGISGILIPYVPGLKIYNCPIDERNCDISKLIPDDINIKCLLAFKTPNQPSCFNKLIQECLLRENSCLAIGGAVIERSESPRGSIVAFCGRSVEAASIIIKPKDKETEVESKLKLFKETGLFKHRCIAFMFACVARGFFIYREYNTESSVFHKLYPDVPLIGVFGNGEIGIDYLPNVPKENQVLRIGKLVRCRKRYLHSYSTVFVLISIKV